MFNTIEYNLWILLFRSKLKIKIFFDNSQKISKYFKFINPKLIILFNIKLIWIFLFEFLTTLQHLFEFTESIIW